MILDAIVEKRLKDVEALKRERPLENFALGLTPSDRNFRDIALPSGFGIIAEFKRSSPSEGRFPELRSLEDTVRIYERESFVRALSILTEPSYFGGRAEDLSTARRITGKPLLRKDFIVDEYQIYESRFFGADAILLIARILSSLQMAAFAKRARTLGMDVLFEIHDEDDLDKLPPSAEIIGINNRDLDSLEINLNTTIRLAAAARSRYDAAKKMSANSRPGHHSAANMSVHGPLKKETETDRLILVTESGILSSADMASVRGHAHAALIGTGILKSADPSEKLRSLFRPKVKICGITRQEDALLAAELGADYLGFVQHRRSARYIEPQSAARIIEAVKSKYPEILAVAVFADESEDEIRAVLSAGSFDLVQAFAAVEGLEPERQIPVIRVSGADQVTLPASAEQFHAVLLDAYHPDLAGGTGVPFDHSILSALSRSPVIFAAGGIGAGNVSGLLEKQVKGLDLSSSVEAAPGIKDPDRLREFFAVIPGGR